MALKIAMKSPYGGDLPSAYLKISKINLDIHENCGNISIKIWQNKAARQAGALILGQIDLSVLVENDINTLDFASCVDKTRAQLYILLKTKKVKFNGQDLDLTKTEDD